MAAKSSRQTTKRRESIQAKETGQVVSMVGSGGRDGTHAVDIPRRESARLKQARTLSNTKEQEEDKHDSTMFTKEYDCNRIYQIENERELSEKDQKPKTEIGIKQRRVLSDRSKNKIVTNAKVTRQPSTVKEDDNDHVELGVCKGTKRMESREVSMDTIEPCRVVVSPMDISKLPTPSSMLPTSNTYPTIGALVTIPPVPRGVVDIDVVHDSFAPYTYSRNIVDYWLSREDKCAMKLNFLDNSPDVTPRMRAVLMNWLLQVQEHEEKLDETFHVCRVLIDRILARGGIGVCKLQLVGITCLLIASKFCERFATETKTLIYLTDSTYTEQQLLDYEKEILVTLDWDIARPVCTHFLEMFLLVDKHHTPNIAHLSMYLLDLSVLNAKLACVLPSQLAAAAVLLARHLLMHTESPASAIRRRSSGMRQGIWPRSLQFYTGFTVDDLWSIVEDMAALVSKAPHSKYQGARSKHNSQDRQFISYHPLLGVESHAQSSTSM